MSQFGFVNVSFIWSNLQKKQKWPFRSSRQCSSSMSTDYSADSTLILFSPPAAILSSAAFQISSGIRGRPTENGSGSNRMEKVPSSKSRRSAKVQIEGARHQLSLSAVI